MIFSVSAKAAQLAEVITDGAMVYQHADFDSTVIGYLQRGQKVKVSNRTEGPFYKVQFSEGNTGYVSDVDVKVKGSRRPRQEELDIEFDDEAEIHTDDEDFEFDDSPPPNKYRNNNADKKYNSEASSARWGLSSSYLVRYSYAGKEADGTAEIMGADNNFFVYGLDINFPYHAGGIYPNISIYVTPFLTNSGKDRHKKDGYESYSGLALLIFNLTLAKELHRFTGGRAGIHLGVGPTISSNLLKLKGEDRADKPLIETRLGVVGYLSLDYRFRNFNLIIKPTYYYEITHYFALAFGLSF